VVLVNRLTAKIRQFVVVERLSCVVLFLLYFVMQSKELKMNKRSNYGKISLIYFFA